MANATGQLSSPVIPSAFLEIAVSNFLLTGALTAPTVATPTFRTGSTTTYTTASASTLSIPLSSNIVVGDFILMAATTGSGSVPTALPAGFSLLGKNSQTWLFVKVAQAGDPGSNVSFTPGFTSQWAVCVCSYSNVSTAIPSYMTTNSTASVTSANAPIITTPVASTVVEVFGCTSGAPVPTGPVTQRVAANLGTVATVISDQTQGAAGSTGTQTCTSTGTTTFAGITMILVGQPSGGTPPPGGWTVVDSYGTMSSASVWWTVWQSPSSSNNAGSTWYLGRSCSLGAGVGVGASGSWLFETYNPSNRQFNAAAIQSVGSAPPFTPSSGTTPPYAQVSGAPNTIGSAYTTQWAPVATIVAGTTNFLVAANRDGFFLSAMSGATPPVCVYVGSGTTLVSNPNLTDPVLLFGCDFTNAQPGSVTREPGWTVANTYWGTYGATAFMPNTAISVSSVQGSVNGSAGDFYLAPNTPVAARILMSRAVASGGGMGATGAVRGLLPAWLQHAPQTACAWGDTVTETSDTLTFVGGTTPNYLWVDTTAA